MNDTEITKDELVLFMTNQPIGTSRSAWMFQIELAKQFTDAETPTVVRQEELAELMGVSTRRLRTIKGIVLESGFWEVSGGYRGHPSAYKPTVDLVNAVKAARAGK